MTVNWQGALAARRARLYASATHHVSEPAEPEPVGMDTGHEPAEPAPAPAPAIHLDPTEIAALKRLLAEAS